MSNSNQNSPLIIVASTLRVALLSGLYLVAESPVLAQEKPANVDESKTIRRQKFKTLEEAIVGAEVELAREHIHGVATVIFSARARDEHRFRGKAEIRLVGPSATGYHGGMLSDGEYVLDPMFIVGSTIPVELHIIVPGYERYVRPMILQAGDLLVWDDIVLEPLTPRNTGSIVGRVRLEDPKQGLNRILISVDDEAVAFTDEQGAFVVEGARPGMVKIQATKAGFVGLSAEVRVVVGGRESCLLVGYRKRYALVRWAYQPDGTRSFVENTLNGEAVLMTNNLRRVSFSRGFKDEPFGRSDFLVEQVEDHLILRHFDVSGPERPGSLRIADGSFDDLAAAPETGYEQAKWRLRKGDLFVFHCFDGQHYAMMEIMEVVDKEPVQERP